MRNSSSFLVLFTATLLAACSTMVAAPQASGVDVPMAWTRLDGVPAPLTTDANAAVEQDWWTHFGDPTLDTLISETLANNKSLQIAKARVEEARANRRLLHWLMVAEGFAGHPDEWWHFSYGDQLWAKLSGAPAALYGEASPYKT